MIIIMKLDKLEKKHYKEFDDAIKKFGEVAFRNRRHKIVAIKPDEADQEIRNWCRKESMHAICEHLH